MILIVSRLSYSVVLHFPKINKKNAKKKSFFLKFTIVTAGEDTDRLLIQASSSK